MKTDHLMEFLARMAEQGYDNEVFELNVSNDVFISLIMNMGINVKGWTESISIHGPCGNQFKITSMGKEWARQKQKLSEI